MGITKKMVTAALLVALGVIIPMVFHAIPGAGSIILPMHIPVLMCGLLLGAPFGLACGLLTPLLSSFITGMPPLAYLPSMLVELSVYGLVSGVMVQVLKIKKEALKLYIALVVAMICGRLVGGALNALIFRAGEYSTKLWLSTYFVTGLPGIVIQVGSVPSIVLALKRSRIGGNAGYRLQEN